MDPLAATSLGERITAVALALGFDRAGVARLEPTPESAAFADWIARGRHGEMAWLARDVGKRVDPRTHFDGACSALVVALVYDSAAVAEPTAGHGRIARYAGGDDYHDAMLDRLRAVGDALEPLAQRAVRWRAYVDTGPVLERVLAAHAGLGWIGKNTCVIDPELGSYLFLGVLITDLELEPAAREPDHCGSCRACLDACPTDAFPAPYVLDATRCLAYTTIELRGAIPESLRAPQRDLVFGCDICQDVCPWNRRRAVSGGASFEPRPGNVAPSFEELARLTPEEFSTRFRKNPVKRPKRRGLLRNVAVAIGNAGSEEQAALLESLARDEDPVVREHAEWGLVRLRARLREEGSPAPGRV